MGEPGVWGEVTARLGVSRPVLVARLLELDAARGVTTAHVRVGSPRVSHLRGCQAVAGCPQRNPRGQASRCVTCSIVLCG
ncbi:hypothetical protein TPA0598_13_00130 [Streptomyces lydicamycinicus]|uniref:Uncharacterized protein n=1 Tax=Streptomyces lydicamycinicus TaxID=1546107 RepID=A0A0P4RGF0_9ACTN|nr:hypothetical protein TPA0598_13_00130 [Streptomyces lydicamycinicus]